MGPSTVKTVPWSLGRNHKPKSRFSEFDSEFDIRCWLQLGVPPAVAEEHLVTKTRPSRLPVIEERQNFAECPIKVDALYCCKGFPVLPSIFVLQNWSENFFIAPH